MFEWSALVIFITATLVLLLTPGPAVLFIVARSLEQGKLAGLVSALGIAAGALIHVAFAAFGISELLTKSAVAFSVVKYAGAAYLIYLGIQSFRSQSKQVDMMTFQSQSLMTIFRQGFIVNLFNPKTALFFLSFLPQFIDPAAGNALGQVLTLGAIFVSIAIMTDSVFALAAGSVGDWLAGNKGMMRRQKQVSGVIYIGLGLLTAFGGRTK